MHYPIHKNNVGLKPLEKSDYEILYKWHTDTKSLYLWQVDRDIRNYENFVSDFEKRLRRNIDFCFIIYNIKEQMPIGLIYNYNTNITDQTTYLCVYLQPESKGAGILAGELFLSHLFYHQNFRKVYIEVFDYNYKVVRLAQMKGFIHEGQLKEHRWHGDRYWDLHLLALYMGDFSKRYPSKMD